MGITVIAVTAHVLVLITHVLVGVLDPYPKGLIMKIWKQLKGPKGRKISLFAGEVVSYAGITALLIYPERYNLLSLFVACVLLVLVLSPFIGHAAEVSEKGESGFKFSLFLTSALALQPFATFAVKSAPISDSARLGWLIVTYIVTSLIARWSRKKLPGV